MALVSAETGPVTMLVIGCSGGTPSKNTVSNLRLVVELQPTVSKKPPTPMASTRRGNRLCFTRQLLLMPEAEHRNSARPVLVHNDYQMLDFEIRRCVLLEQLDVVIVQQNF